MSNETNLNLLFGILANQLGFVTEVDVLSALRRWSSDRSTSLADLLQRDNKLNEAQKQAINTVAIQHLQGSEADSSRAAAHSKKLPGSLHLILSAVHSDAERFLKQILDQDSFVTRLDEPFDSLKTLPTNESTTPSMSLTDGCRYEILHEHARGGLGEVFVARDTELSREVALKQILHAFIGDPACRARFLLEAEITGSLEHPGIVPVYGLGQRPDGRPYYAMRFIRGESLESAIAQLYADTTTNRPLKLRKLLHRFVAVCHAVHFAHSRGVLHRDLKPSNIMLGPYGESLVVDWGLARLIEEPGSQHDRLQNEQTLHPVSVTDSASTRWGTLVGTPAFMSPEQALGWHDKLTPASDVYSLGATLYTLLTGKPAFGNDSLEETILMVQQGVFPAPRTVRPEIPRALEAICQKAMATSSKNRYPSAQQLGDELETYLADEPITAWREPWGNRLGRWTRRHRALTAGGLAAGAMLVVGLAILAIVLSRARNEEARLRQITESHYELAHDAVARQFVLVSENPQLKHNQFEGLRRDLLESARDFYQKLLAHRAHDRELVYEDAWVRFRLGEINWEIGNLAETRSFFEQAGRLFDELIGDGATDIETRSHLAMVYLNLGNISFQNGDSPRAKQELNRALEMTEQLLRVERSPKLQLLLANCLNVKAALAMADGKLDDALIRYEQSVKIFREMHQAKTDDAAAAGRLVSEYSNLAILYRQRGDIAKSEESALAGVAIGRESLAGQTDRPYLLKNYADIQLRLAEIYAESNRFELALDTFQQARETLTKLVHPTVNDFRLSLWTCEENLANLQQAMGLTLEAHQGFERAAALCEQLLAADPDNVQYQAKLGSLLLNESQCLLSLKKFDQIEAPLNRAAAILDRLSTLQANTPEYESARGRLELIQGQRHEAFGEAPEAMLAYQNAVEILEPLAADHQDNPFFRSYLATAHEYLGTLHGMQGDSLKAEQHLYLAYQARRQVLQQLNNARARVELAATQVRLSLAWSDLDRHDEALSMLNEAATSMRQLCSENHQNIQARANLQIAVLQRGLLNADLQHYDVALADFDFLLSQDRSLHADLILLQRATCLARLGRHGEAAQQIQEFRQSPDRDDASLYEAAAVLGLSAEAACHDPVLTLESQSDTRRDYLQMALPLLKELRASGFFREVESRRQLDLDKRFESWRGEPGFQQFLTESE